MITHPPARIGKIDISISGLSGVSERGRNDRRKLMIRKMYVPLVVSFCIFLSISGCLENKDDSNKITALTAYSLLEDHLNGNDFSIFFVESLDNETFNTGKSSGWKFFGGFPLEEGQFDYFLYNVKADKKIDQGNTSNYELFFGPVLGEEMIIDGFNIDSDKAVSIAKKDSLVNEYLEKFPETEMIFFHLIGIQVSSENNSEISENDDCWVLNWIGPNCTIDLRIGSETGEIKQREIQIIVEEANIKTTTKRYDDTIYVEEGNEEVIQITFNETYIPLEISFSVQWDDDGPSSPPYHNNPDNISGSLIVNGEIMDTDYKNGTSSGSFSLEWNNEDREIVESIQIVIKCVYAGKIESSRPVTIIPLDDGNFVSFSGEIEFITEVSHVNIFKNIDEIQ